ncbi:hypothetical protein HN709_04425 [Candidatus Peregrinibacteria bacterium]|nr:hypothetical protein [Candidatus Peregrinibacteria bacterium]MBT7736910.1 hypothetical protein [Candidatus Peregrinibacteria bacterium]
MNNEIEKKLWGRVENYLSVLQMVPFVKMVAVCNNLAFGKVDDRSDIDLFVVAEEGHLFFVRTFVTALLHFMGVRRHGKNVSGRFCLSFFIDDSSCDLSKVSIYDDVYLAFWIKSMKPVIDNGFSGSFFNDNLWARDYFEKKEDFELSLRHLLPVNPLNSVLKSFFSVAFGGSIGSFLEKRLSSWQKKRALRKASRASEDSSLIVDDHILKFHNKDRRVFYRDLWRSKFGERKINDKRFLSL